MIIAAGLSPAWQQILSFDTLRLGEVNRAHDARWCASGKVLNVGIALAHLHAPAVTIAPLGGNVRAAVAAEFADLNARGRWIETECRTRMCTTLLDASSGVTTELVENALPLTAAELSRFEKLYLSEVDSASAVVLTGSSPSGTPPDFFRRLMQQTRAPVILDIRGLELEEALAANPFLVKPNRFELAQTVGRPLESDADLAAAMQTLNDRGAQWVVVSQGSQAVWASSAGRFFRLKPPAVQAVNAIGSGDCLAAAIAWQVDLGTAPLDALRLGIAAASINATMLLPGRLNSRDVELLARSITIESA